MPIMHVGSKRTISPQAMCARSRPRSVTPAVSPIKVHAGISTLRGMTRPSSGMARSGAETGRAAQRVGDDHHHAAIGDLERREELDGGTPLSPRPGAFHIDIIGW